MVFYIGVIFTRPSSFPMAAKLGESVLDTIIKRGERRLKNKEMRFNFKKISALGTSLFLAGATLGIAAAANYPAPFVEGGAADVAIVVGTGEGVSLLDSLEAGFISTDLQAEMGGTGATEASVTGEAVSLDTSATRIWINTSLNTAKSTLTKSDLPTVLSDYTFNGNVDAKITSTIKLQAGAAAGSDNSGKVIFAKQPKSNVDPVLGVSLGTSHSSNPLYNASATMRATNFTHSDSIGSEIQLFGQKFTVSADTSISDTTKIVLLKEAEKFSLDSNNPSKTVEIGGETYTITLVSASDTAATVQVTDSAGTSDSKEVSEADSKKINGVEVGVTAADETNLLLSATIIAGAQKLTFTQGTQVTTGSSGDPIDGTYVHLVGGAGAVTELAVTVYRPDSSTDAIVAGDSFVDPVFGSFKFEFAGMSSPLDDASRGIIELDNSGDDSMTMTMTDDSGNKATFDVSHNQSGVHRL